MATQKKPTSDSSIRWSKHLQDLARQIRPAHESVRSEIRGALWQVIRTAIFGYARLHASKLGQISNADILDISSQKALEILQRFDSLKWNPEAESEEQIRAFLSTVARNGVVDILRMHGRVIRMRDMEEPDMMRPENFSYTTTENSPLNKIEADEFIECLHDCVKNLSPRARKLWFLRVLYELPSKQIANHPEINMNVGNVDVALQRCRIAISNCLQNKGMKLRILPTGTFSALWETCTRCNQALLEDENHG